MVGPQDIKSSCLENFNHRTHCKNRLYIYICKSLSCLAYYLVSTASLILKTATVDRISQFTAAFFAISTKI